MATHGTSVGAKATEVNTTAASSISASTSSTECALKPISSEKDGEPAERDGRWGEAFTDPVNVGEALHEYEEYV